MGDLWFPINIVCAVQDENTFFSQKLKLKSFKKLLLLKVNQKNKLNFQLFCAVQI